MKIQLTKNRISQISNHWNNLTGRWQLNSICIKSDKKWDDHWLVLRINFVMMRALKIMDLNPKLDPGLKHFFKIYWDENIFFQFLTFMLKLINHSEMSKFFLIKIDICVLRQKNIFLAGLSWYFAKILAYHNCEIPRFKTFTNSNIAAITINYKIK